MDLKQLMELLKYFDIGIHYFPAGAIHNLNKQPSESFPFGSFDWVQRYSSDSDFLMSGYSQLLLAVVQILSVDKIEQITSTSVLPINFQCWNVVCPSDCSATVGSWAFVRIYRWNFMRLEIVIDQNFN
jgi:hypothetical protein